MRPGRQSSLEEFPNTQGLGGAPGLSITAALSMRRVAIENLRDVPQATRSHQSFHAAQVRAGGSNGFRREVPGAHESFAEDRKSPGPGSAVVVSRFAAVGHTAPA